MNLYVVHVWQSSWPTTRTACPAVHNHFSSTTLISYQEWILAVIGGRCGLRSSCAEIFLIEIFWSICWKMIEYSNGRDPLSDWMLQRIFISILHILTSYIHTSTFIKTEWVSCGSKYNCFMDNYYDWWHTPYPTLPQITFYLFITTSLCATIYYYLLRLPRKRWCVKCVKLE